MNDRFSTDKDRLVHKADEDDLNTPRHGEEAAPEFREPHHGDAGRTDTSSLDPDTGTRDPLISDRDDVLVVESSDDRHTAVGSDASFDDDRRDMANDGVPGDLDGDGRNDSPFAHAQPSATTPGTPVTGAYDSPVASDLPGSTADRPDDVLDESTGFTDAERTGQTPATTAPTTAGALFDQDADDVRRRWQEVQAGFVDDPRDAVERADSLLDEVTGSLRNALETRATELQGRWKNTEKNDTEDLRTALRDYRATLEQLLNISAGTR
ncbi:hypothetical protein ABT352_23430 [Streptosporangium sp. NPDC000563]|uniref:hypothetical protein n=1 Tax=Streptosporangium sp. NPDC000563 TaxID=3154366 RepID=UPI00332BEAA5